MCLSQPETAKSALALPQFALTALSSAPLVIIEMPPPILTCLPVTRLGED